MDCFRNFSVVLDIDIISYFFAGDGRTSARFSLAIYWSEVGRNFKIKLGRGVHAIWDITTILFIYSV